MLVVSYLAYYDTSLPNATDITIKHDCIFIIKRDKYLLRNPTVIIKCDIYYKMRRTHLIKICPSEFEMFGND